VTKAIKIASCKGSKNATKKRQMNERERQKEVQSKEEVELQEFQVKIKYKEKALKKGSSKHYNP
jgi:hypothetical protein